MKVKVKKSTLHGNGLFATRDIKRGETLFIFKGKPIHFLINNKKRAKEAGLNWVGYGKNFWIDPSGNYTVNANHSCDPNAFLKDGLKMLALRNIKKDEEITFDYSLNESDIFWSMKCSCGSKKCRKIVTSIQFLSKEFLRKHAIQIPSYFKQISKEFNFLKFKDRRKLQKVWVDFLKKDFKV